MGPGDSDSEGEGFDGEDSDNNDQEATTSQRSRKQGEAVATGKNEGKRIVALVSAGLALLSLIIGAIPMTTRHAGYGALVAAFFLLLAWLMSYFTLEAVSKQVVRDSENLRMLRNRVEELERNVGK